ncbi:MAG: transposase [Candidatus Uhrbacteria bacterium]|nr:transposase [Candidatus Uhrbacteria bacterium]
MKHLHVNTRCLHASIVIHGLRRRRCTACRKTWTIRKKKQGRKRKRLSKNVLCRYLAGKSVRTPPHVLRATRDLFVRTTPWPDLTEIIGPCVLIVDALHIRTSVYTAIIHVLLLKPIHEERAFILPFWTGTKTESKDSWRRAFEAQIPPMLRSRIKALVCDGKSGLPELAREYGWVVQRCQFHLIARLQLKRSKYALSRHRKEGVRLYELARTICDTTSQRKLQKALQTLLRIVRLEKNRHLKTILSGLVKHHQDYRTYLAHPDLCLPTTTNSVESLNSLIRDLLYRMRGCRISDSVLLWIEALLKYRSHIHIQNHRD